MKEHRLQVFRAAVEGLIESLEAVIRISRWTDAEPKPEPLVASASKLLDRLGSANRLSAARFQGSPAEVTKVAAICVVLKRLDAAYLLYRQQLETVQKGPATTSDAIAGLETELAALTEGSATWR
jgi:hypothetical protein